MKSITKILFAAALVTCLVKVDAKTALKAGHIINSVQYRHVSGYSAISVSGSYDVVITQGQTETVKVDAPDEVIDHIVTEVKNGTLNITDKRDNFSWDNWFGGHKKIVVYVTAKSLNGISLSGSGDVFFKDGITGVDMRISISGSGDINGKLNVKTLQASVTGSGDIKLVGQADNASVRVSGSGDYSAKGLLTIYTAIHVAGSGDASINASDKIDASVSGSGDISYTGTARQISTSKAGSGDIERM